MPWTRDPSLSIRDNIMEHLKARFYDATEDGTMTNTQTGVPFDTTIRWNAVLRAPLPKAEIIIGNALSITDPRERKQPEVGATRCTLTVVTEFALKTMMGDNVSSELNKMMTEVQRIMLSDISAGGLCLHIVESSSELDIEGPGDRLVGGVIFWDIQYRHKLGDPTKHRGEL